MGGGLYLDARRVRKRAPSRLPMQSASPLPASAPELQAVIAAERASEPFLLHRDESGAQRMLSMGQSVTRLSVGRRSGNDIVLFWDNDVSRVHVELEQIGGEWAAKDDGLSRNGTYVNGARINGRHRLRDRDTLRVGNTLLVFRSPRPLSGVATHAGAEQLSAERLSPAQRRVLVALCRPFKESVDFVTPATNQQIGDELVLSVDAVKTHVRALFAKFGVGDLPQNQKRARLVERAFLLGVVSDRDL